MRYSNGEQSYAEGLQTEDAQLLGITLPWRWHLAAAIKTTGRLTSYAATLAELRHWRNAQSGKATGVVVPI